MATRKSKQYNALPKFIWGSSATYGEAVPSRYLVHNRWPRFICRVDDGALITLSDHIFLDRGPPPSSGILDCVHQEAIVNYAEMVFGQRGMKS